MNRSRILGLTSVVITALISGCSSDSGTAAGTRPGIADGEIPGAAAGSNDGSDHSSGGSTVVPGSPSGSPEGPSFGAAGASGSSDSSGSAKVSGSSGSAGSAGAGGAAGSSGSSDGPTPTLPPVRPEPPVQPEPGILTAGAWDDNRNFARFLRYRTDLVSQQLPGLIPFTEDEHRAANSAFSAPLPAHAKLDVSFVIDTTGSMGDELQYLTSEFLALSQTISGKYPNAEQRWSLVLYRDTVDEYVVRWFDFGTDPQEFRAHLAAQSADGGGDLPESPERGLSTAAQLAWRTGSDAAKLAFWVADAPHHEQNAAAMATAVHAIQSLGIHVYPVAASGADELTEVSMRSAAQLTGGRYLFLTDDSGVGGAHKEPSIPCYFVTKLDRAILRMVDIEMTGRYREPDPAEVLRTGGDPHDGSCTLATGETVVVF